MTWQPLPRGHEDGRDGGEERGPRLVRESLDQFARRLGAPQAAAVGAVFAGWEDAVGPTVAAHCRPVSLRNGVLTVSVEQPAWATQLRYLAADVIRRLEEVAGTGLVTRLEVRVRRS